MIPSMIRPWWLLPLALGCIVLGAILLRFVDLAANPGGLYLDEAAEALSAHRLLHEPGFHPIFFADGGGREALFAYLVAGAFAIFGESTFVLRATAAAIGVAAVVAIWDLGRRFGEAGGLVAAGWAAGSLWLVCISRDGMRNILVPLLSALALTTLLAWADRPSRGRAVLAGALTALAALYTYQPLKLLPLLAVIWIVVLWRTNRAAFDRMLASLLFLVTAFGVVAIPMLLVAVFEPAAYFGRALGVLALAPEGAGTNFIDHVLRTLGMFGLTGDPNPRHDVDALPLIAWPVALVALVGVVHLWRHRRQTGDALVLWSLPVFLLPPLVATEGGAPHFLRSLGLAAPLAVTIGLGALDLVQLLRRRWGDRAAPLGIALGVASLIGLGVGSGVAYLGRPVAERYDAYRFDLVAMADAAGPTDVVILDDYSANVIRFLDRDHLPAIVPPGTAIADPARFTRILALNATDLDRALGGRIPGQILVLARHPDGEPSLVGASP